MGKGLVKYLVNFHAHCADKKIHVGTKSSCSMDLADSLGQVMISQPSLCPWSRGDWEPKLSMQLVLFPLERLKEQPKALCISHWLISSHFNISEQGFVFRVWRKNSDSALIFTYFAFTVWPKCLHSWSHKCWYEHLKFTKKHRLVHIEIHPSGLLGGQTEIVNCYITVKNEVTHLSMYCIF